MTDGSKLALCFIGLWVILTIMCILDDWITKRKKK